MHNTLRADIHIGPSSHLSILGYTHGIEFFPVIGPGIIRNHHAIGNDYSRRIFRRRKQSQWVTGIHHQRLFVGYLGEIFHSEQVLSPVLEYRPISTISNKLVRMLCHRFIQIILNHQHNGCCFLGTMRILINRPGVHLIFRAETMHVNTPIGF